MRSATGGDVGSTSSRPPTAASCRSPRPRTGVPARAAASDDTAAADDARGRGAPEPPAGSPSPRAVVLAARAGAHATAVARAVEQRSRWSPAARPAATPRPRRAPRPRRLEHRGSRRGHPRTGGARFETCSTPAAPPSSRPPARIHGRPAGDGAKQSILGLCERLVVIEAVSRCALWRRAGNRSRPASHPGCSTRGPPESAAGNRLLIEMGALPIPVPIMARYDPSGGLRHEAGSSTGSIAGGCLRRDRSGDLPAHPPFDGVTVAAGIRLAWSQGPSPATFARDSPFAFAGWMRGHVAAASGCISRLLLSTLGHRGERRQRHLARAAVIAVSSPGSPRR